MQIKANKLQNAGSSIPRLMSTFPMQFSREDRRS